MSLPDLSFPLPDLSNASVYPTVAHGASCTDPQPAPSSCFPDLINVVRPFAFPTEALGQLRQPLSRLTNLIPVPPPVGTHCASPRMDLAAANAGQQTGDEPEVDFLISRPEGDACLPLLTPLITFPCTSVTAAIDGGVTMVNDPSQAAVTHLVTKNDAARSCSTDIKVSARVPCVVPTIIARPYSAVKAADLESGEGSDHAAAQAEYAAAVVTYTTDVMSYTAAHALYLSQMSAYTAALATYATDYATFTAAMATYRAQLELQPLPEPLPVRPVPPAKPVLPVAPIMPVAPVAPLLTAASVSGGGTLLSLVSGPPCNRTVRLGLKVSAAGSSAGSGFLIGDSCSSTSPFGSDAFVAEDHSTIHVFPPGAPTLPAVPREVPLVDKAGVFGPPCTLLDPTVFFIVNQTKRSLVYGDIVSAAKTNQTIGSDTRVVIAIVDS